MKDPCHSTYRLFVDGACRGNPGPASYAFILYQGSRPLKKGGGYLGDATNNIAEYTALIKGLEAALEMGIQNSLEIYSDSQLLVRQMEGSYKVKQPHLKTLHAQAQNLLKRIHQARIFHIERARNREADRLANRVLDEAMEKAGQSPAGLKPREESPGPTGQGAG